MGLMGAIAREVISGGGAVLGSALIPFRLGCYDFADKDGDDDDDEDSALLGLLTHDGNWIWISIFMSLLLTTSSSFTN